MEPGDAPGLSAYEILRNREQNLLGMNMPELEAERGHLAKADRDIADGERRITAQLLLIEELRTGGHDTNEAERLLLALRQTLEGWWEHRTLIVQAIARLERAPPR